jgi:hypothetical protein
MTTEKKLSPNVEALAMLRDFAKQTQAAALLGLKASGLLVQAAIKSGEHFADTVEALYGEIRVDANGLAKAVGAERNKAQTAYVVPNSIMAQVSQVLRAVKFGVDLGTADKPKGLGEIRTATKAAAEKEEEAKTAQAVALLTGDDAVKMALMKALTEAASAIKAASGPTLDAMRLATEDYCTAMIAIVDKAKAETAQAQTTETIEPKAEEATKADAIADAAAEAPQAAEAPAPRVTIKRKRAA